MTPSPHPLNAARHRLWRAGLTGLALVAAGTLVAYAQSAMPAGSPGRFTMQPADGGILRLDTQTGALSMCRKAADSWSCSLLPDDRSALNEEIKRLKAENDDLKNSVKRLEELAGVPGASPGSPRAGVQLPSEEDVDKAMNYVERMLKKFKDKLRELEGSEGRRGQPL